jgi:hypothetical protein
VVSTIPFYLFLADFVLFVHLLWCVWVLFGWSLTHGRPFLRALHIASLVWVILVEILPWTLCPLTIAESWLETRGGIGPPPGAFLTNLLDEIVYPNLPNWLIISGAVAVCSFILFIYVRRFLHRKVNHSW